MKKLLPLFVFMALLLSSCNPDDDAGSTTTDPESNFEENFGAEVSRKFIGQVNDINGNAVQGATVRIGSLSVQTDANGVFLINGASVREKFAYIRVSKTGFMDGSRALIPTSGTNNVKITLIPATITGTVSSGQSGEVALPSGTKVLFDGSFMDENGAVYSGDVAVSMYHLLPSDENLNTLMPGMLYAETQTGEEALLQTLGMINVELRGSGGQKLQPSEGHPAQIEIMIDATQLATAPTTIPLWHFDPERGYWKEDGIATRQGNKYTGEVSHFSWWNCDTPFPTVGLTVNVVDENGNSLINTPVVISFNSSMGVWNGYNTTDEN